RTSAVQVSVPLEILGTRGKIVSQQVNEFLAGPRQQRIVRQALLTDRRGTLRTHLTAAERSGSMRRKDLRIVRKRQQLLVKALVRHGRQLLRRVGRRKVRPAHIAYKERVSGEECSGPAGLSAIVHQNANALKGVSRSLQEPKAALAESNLVSVLHRDVREFST